MVERHAIKIFFNHYPVVEFYRNRRYPNNFFYTSPIHFECFTAEKINGANELQ